ncbi:6-hydroxy-D-nicotine oxidase [Staphylotrichum tortipilum]|uniref:6-hydroxy-D-nicotine oxidase n=1 Tax=Staphylotrichum tortipilum TaxID=2831512 RepID=A0AAN6MKJ9_9PEZI|nr:6-hydroxy-D-nicotine oxidase [Staphylotrichum longicolle]
MFTTRPLTTLLLPLLPLLLLALFSSSATPTPTPLSSLLFTLPPLLSPTAEIYLPLHPSQPDEQHQHLLPNPIPGGPEPPPHRWSTSPLNTPFPGVIIRAATEADIVATIRQANAHGVPFLATSGGHGVNRALAGLGKEGVVIDLGKMDSFRLIPRGRAGEGRYWKGDVAVVGGGMRTGDLIDWLWAAGRETTTGVCGCTGFAGVVLGGGHGLLQGRYGIGADQIVGARVVLGDGEVVEVDVAREEGRDLLWGLGGAGHNFGVVSELRVKVYEVGEGRKWWAWQIFVFAGGRLEEVYGVAARMMETQPEGVVVWSAWMMMPEIDPVKPVIAFTIFFSGSLDESRRYTEPISSLGPNGYGEGETEYPGLAGVLGAGTDDQLCQPQGAAFMRGIDLDHYDLGALRNWYNTFSEMLAANKALAGSFCMLEGYSMQGVQAVPPESKAYPHRDKKLLFAPAIFYADATNSSLAQEAVRWGEAMRTAAFGTAQRRTYVNYAFGDESLEAMYGYEPWRLEKLRGLKRKYDPENRFRFYAPIV